MKSYDELPIIKLKSSMHPKRLNVQGVSLFFSTLDQVETTTEKLTIFKICKKPFQTVLKMQHYGPCNQNFENLNFLPGRVKYTKLAFRRKLKVYLFSKAHPH